MTAVGFLHPGAMGAIVAATCTADERRWLPTGRSDATRARADEAGLEPVDTLVDLAGQVDVIVSICPPAAAAGVARTVSETEFDGIYVDANAISPDRAAAISRQFRHYVDGGLIGPPPRTTGTTRFYVSGERAPEVAALWQGSELDARVIDDSPTAASALKMAYAGWTKGSSALLLAINALAESAGVRDALVAEWALSQPDVAARSEFTAAMTGPKAWRFGPEMEEIAATLAAADLPDGFHLAAADLYHRLAAFKDRQPGPTLDELMTHLRQ